METTLSKSKMPKKIILKILASILILFTCVLFFFTNTKALEFVTNYFDNSSGVNITIIALIFLTPLLGFLIPFNKTNSKSKTMKTIKNKRRMIESRRKKDLMRLLNANNRR
jgi:uncharacterized integral membrane protein